MHLIVARILAFNSSQNTYVSETVSMCEYGVNSVCRGEIGI